MPARLVLVLAFVFVLPQAAWAQYRNQQRPQSFNDLKDVPFDGSVEGVQGDVVQMKMAATSQPHLIKLQAGYSKVVVTGTAKPDYLKPGMLVSFTADIPPGKEKTIELEQPLTDLQIITASETNKPGLFNEDRENKDSTKFFVRAPVRSYKDGKLTVGAGGKTIIAPLVSETDIKLESTDLSIVRMGDTITGSGKQVSAYKSEGNRIEPGQVVGQEVNIKLQETLTSLTFKKKK